jgi:hypothetical protein
MAQYRRTRNLEASLIDYLIAQLATSWSGINVVKGFQEAYDLNLPVITLRAESSVTDIQEIGDNNECRSYQIMIDIFATDDGMREDLKDFLMDVLKVGCIYYQFVTAKTPNQRGSVVQSKTADGRIRVLKMTETKIKFDIDKDKLVPHDRYRHLIVLTVSRSKLE